MRSQNTSTKKYIKGHAFFCYSLYQLAKFIDPSITYLSTSTRFHPFTLSLLKWTLWSTYWFFQSLVGGGIFCIGHDAGHGTLSDYQLINHTIGYIAHTFILAPYWAWRHSHHLHHKTTGSMERDENYVPKTRSELKMASGDMMKRADYEEIFGETPIWTLGRMLVMQLMGWQLYLTYNTLGSPMYPPGTNHWSPSSALFKKSDRVPILFTNTLLFTWISILGLWTYNTSISTFVKYYFIPYLFTNHWIVMFTFLHHTDPTMPHFRKDTWTFLRGAVTTVDRPLLGWMGRFFLHNISHDHVAHHFFSGIPFWNGPELSEHVRKAMGSDYNGDSTNTFRALYRSFTQCEFVEDDGDIIMWKNKKGEAARKIAGTIEVPLSGDQSAEADRSQ
ncbi:fatty acid conjugase [Cantharellus anzutake]|uniref:fatty acid conjugase n=1 Tax=Cantharellus anzutake TaxID=1750568 RepID=UPI001902F130|nr:fatty acid conjugase [Cantharellus anzutake]KAF8324722.1 fatty acid conjugase [Cantharellus anzutake]